MGAEGLKWEDIGVDYDINSAGPEFQLDYLPDINYRISTSDPKEMRRRIKSENEYLFFLKNRYNKSSGFEQYWIEHEMADTEELISKYKRTLQFINNKPTENKVDFEKVKGISIIKVIESYGIKLEATGNKRYRCLCPFHQETLPSMVVYEDKNNFFCFGCGKGSSTIDFVMFMDNCDNYTAAKKLLNFL